jgi:hypothetical protein
MLDVGSHVADNMSQSECVAGSQWSPTPITDGERGIVLVEGDVGRFSGRHACKSSMATSCGSTGVSLKLETM